MGTETIYRVALIYAQYAGLELSGQNMPDIITAMRDDLYRLAEEYGIDTA